MLLPDGLHRADSRIVRQINMRAIFRLLRDNGRLGTSEMARLSGLSPVTVNYVLERLMELGLVASVGEGPSTGGRKPTLYAVNPDDSILCGIDVSIGRVTVGFLDLTGKMLWSKSTEINTRNWDDLLPTIEDVTREGRAKLGKTLDMVVGAAVCIPGFVDLSGKTVVLDVNLNYSNLHVADTLQERLEIPVFVVEKAAAGMLAELEYGDSQLGEDVIFVQIGNGWGRGIGGAIKSKGAILRGRQGFAGEIGHMSLDPNGPKCTCGRNGCWEALGQLSSFVADVKRVVPEPKRRNYNRSFTDVCELVRNHDARIADLYERFVNLHAEAISNLIHIFNPSAVVIGGEVTNLGESFLNPLRQATERLLMSPFRNSYQMVQSVSDDHNVLRGATVVLLEQAISLRQKAG